MFDLWWLIPVSIGISTLAMLTGAEGAILFCILFSVIGLPPHAIIGTAFLTQIIGKTSGTLGFSKYLIMYRLKEHVWKKELSLIQWDFVFWIGIFGGIIILVSSFVSQMLKATVLLFSFGVFLSALGLLMLGLFTYSFARSRSKKKNKQIKQKAEKDWVDIKSFGIFSYLWIGFASVLTGLYGVGIGSMNTILLNGWYKLKIERTAATVVGALAVTAWFGSFGHYGSADPNIYIYTIPGVALGGQLGPCLTEWSVKIKKTVWIKAIFGVFTLIVGILFTWWSGFLI